MWQQKQIPFTVAHTCSHKRTAPKPAKNLPCQLVWNWKISAMKLGISLFLGAGCFPTDIACIFDWSTCTIQQTKPTHPPAVTPNPGADHRTGSDNPQEGGYRLGRGFHSLCSVPRENSCGAVKNKRKKKYIKRTWRHSEQLHKWAMFCLCLPYIEWGL